VCPDGLSCEGGYCVEPGQVCRPSFAKVTAGTGFACAIDESNALWCWGSNTHLQIAPGDRLQFPLATRIEGRTWEAIDAGGEHVCGVSSGQLYCWGRNDHAQAGPLPGDVAAPFPITVLDGPSQWSAVSAGERSTCAIGDGRLYCWGSNQYGVLGIGGSPGGDIADPTAVATTLMDWTAVDVGSYHACAVSAGSGVFCWGYSGNGRVGPNATAPEQTTPVLALASASAVAVSDRATCAAAAGGELRCWGANDDGELGEGNAAVTESATPLLASTVTGWTAVTADKDKLCGLAGDAIYCWGRANLGGLGNGLWTDQDRFAKVMSGARALSLGWNRDPDMIGSDGRELELACALVGSDVQCWGDNRYGQLGRGNATMALAPAEIAGGHLWTKLAVGNSHGCGIDGRALYCWGATTDGQTTGMLTGASSPRTPCIPSLDCDVGTPKSIGFASDPIDVAAGATHTCALHNDLITCWGNNGSNQLGTSAAPPFKRDVPQPGGRPWASLIATGRNGQCASPGGTEVWCWGSVLTQHLPMREISLDGIRAIGVGETMTCALDAAGMLRCSGSNDQGQYGTGGPPGICPDGACNNGETAASCPADCGPGPLAPTQRGYAALAVSSTSSFACGLRGDAVECWGANDRGQTGAVDGSNMLIHPTFRANPVLGLSGCTAITAGDQHACAICDGKIRCWGDQTAGSLGSGPLTADPVPIPRTIDLILEGDPWVELFSGLRFSCARSEAGHVYCWGSDPHAGLGNGATSANLPVTVLASPIR
jgi:alpha-tubulin suppressor-like RCC1 family protein